jgi:hypothetical protein
VKYILAVFALLLVTACSGGGGGSSTPTVYPLAGSYYGTVVSSAGNSGNMGVTTDASGNGNFALQYPGESAIQETFAPPVSSVSGNTLSINGTIAGACTLKLNATMVNSNTLKGSYSINCSGAGSGSANFTLPRGTYSVSTFAHHMVH